MNQLIKRLVIRNYKSIESCSLDLRNFTLLVGQNGSGKSNIVDAICFVRDSLRTSLEFAIRERGGVAECRRKSGGHPTNFAIRLDIQADSLIGSYAFEIAAKSNSGYLVNREQCEVRAGTSTHKFIVEKGRLISSNLSNLPVASGDRLYLVNASGLPQFRAFYDALSRMGFYNLNPKAIKDLQEPDEGQLLEKYGGNLASVFARLERQAPETKRRIEEYVNRVVRSVHGVDFKAIGPRHTLEFRQDVAGQKFPWRFWASSMSDGTLRALGVLTAIFQSTDENVVPFVAIEEPETALHPAASGVLFDSLQEASARTQVLVTSHSADLLDRKDIDVESLFVVSSVDGVTRVGPIDAVTREAVRNTLFTPGELLRVDQLPVDESVFKELRRQPDLFEGWQ